MTVRRCQGNYLSFYHVATKIQFPPMRCQPPSLHSSDEVTPAIRHALWHRPRHNINTGYYLSRAQHILNRLASAPRSFHPLSGNLLEAGIHCCILLMISWWLVSSGYRDCGVIRPPFRQTQLMVKSSSDHMILPLWGLDRTSEQSGEWKQRPDFTWQLSKSRYPLHIYLKSLLKNLCKNTRQQESCLIRYIF